MLFSATVVDAEHPSETTKDFLENLEMRTDLGCVSSCSWASPNPFGTRLLAEPWLGCHAAHLQNMFYLCPSWTRGCFNGVCSSWVEKILLREKLWKRCLTLWNTTCGYYILVHELRLSNKVDFFGLELLIKMVTKYEPVFYWYWCRLWLSLLHFDCSMNWMKLI